MSLIQCPRVPGHALLKSFLEVRITGFGWLKSQTFSAVFERYKRSDETGHTSISPGSDK